MKTIQVVMDELLLRSADRAARKLKVNRSTFIREAVAGHLRGMDRRRREEQDRDGYRLHPNRPEMAVWDTVAAWPEE